MKKILALLLILACSFALFACKDDKTDPDAEAYAAAVAEFAQASIAAPKGVNISVTTETALGALKSSYATTYNEDGSATPRGERVLAKTPMGRYGDPVEMCGPVIFLCSEAASFVNGAVLPVDGGFASYWGV